MRHAQLAFISILIVAVTVLAACGGPASPSADGIVLRGTVVGTAGVAASSLSVRAAVATDVTVTVTVQENTAITTTVGADGTFTLRGLPEGGFHLVFSSGGITLGTIAFREVRPNQEITVTVQVSGSTVTLLEERRNGIGHGDVEIEGDVTAVLLLNATGESRFTIDGKTVVARPGETAIREGNTARTVADVTVGHQVHVKGVWLPAEPSGQPVLAHEIKLQDDDDDDPDVDRTCMISGGRVGDGIELEGNVVSGGFAAFVMRIQGNRSSGNVQVDASGATFKCNGSKGTPADCQASVKADAKVHVSGTLMSCDLATALAHASRVMIQK
ncbi:MAG TPA: carboxypeptidase-like regulatory domain-containing protein [Vicinamibacteria bacterium]